ncbi:Uncharacterised protein [Streptococcus pneumoniae]|nr:Uncharacterised protein [Streptococcus pneumoniae]
MPPPVEKYRSIESLLINSEASVSVIFPDGFTFPPIKYVSMFLYSRNVLAISKAFVTTVNDVSGKYFNMA